MRGALIDFGGTVDTDGIHWMQLFRMAYQSCGLSTDGLRDAYVYAERTLGRNAVITPETTFRDTIRTKLELQLEYMRMKADSLQLLDFCYGYVTENIRNVSAPVLTELSERMPLVLVTNFYGNMHTVLREFGLDACFTDVVESSAVGVRKPDPEIFRIGASRLGMQPSEVVAVGDSPDKDMIPAKAAGCRTVWLSGKGWSDDVSCSPDRVISSLAELAGQGFSAASR